MLIARCPVLARLDDGMFEVVAGIAMNDIDFAEHVVPHVVHNGDMRHIGQTYAAARSVLEPDEQIQHRDQVPQTTPR